MKKLIALITIIGVLFMGPSPVGVAHANSSRIDLDEIPIDIPLPQ